MKTLVGQRVVAMALGYEDLVDHDELRHDPVLAVLAVLGSWPEDRGPPQRLRTARRSTGWSSPGAS